MIRGEKDITDRDHHLEIHGKGTRNRKVDRKRRNNRKKWMPEVKDNRFRR